MLPGFLHDLPRTSFQNPPRYSAGNPPTLAVPSSVFEIAKSICGCYIVHRGSYGKHVNPSPSIRSTPYYTMAGVVSRALLRFGSVNSLISMNSKFLCGSRTSRCYSWVVLTYSIVQKSLLNQRSIWHEIIYRTMHGEKNKVFTIIFRVVKVKDLSDGITSSCIVPRDE